MEQTQALEDTVTGRSRARWLAAVALVIVAGWVLRFWQIGQQSLWFDEGYSAWVVTLAPWRIVEVIRHDVSPPLYYLLLKGWREIFGESEAALRSMSAVASCLAVPVIAAIAWQITRSLGGVLVASLLMSVSVLQIQYAQEARSYGVASLLMALALYGAVRRMQGSEWWLVLSAAMLAGSVYVHNMMWFYVAGFGLGYLVIPGRAGLGRRMAEFAAISVAVILIYAWWIPALLGQVRWLHGNFWAPVPSPRDLAQVLVAAGGMKLMHLGMLARAWVIGWAVALCLGGLCVVVLAGRSRDTVRWSSGLLLIGLFPILAVYGYAQVSQSYFVEKIFTASSLTLPLLAALLPGSRAKVAGFVLIPAIFIGSCISVWGYFAREIKEDWRGAIEYVNSIPREKTMVVFVANEGELLYHYYIRQLGGKPHSLAAAPQGFHELEPPKTIQRVLEESDTDKLIERLHKQNPEKVVLVLSHTHFSDPNDLTRKAIEREMKLVGQKSFHLVDVLEFAR